MERLILFTRFPEPGRVKTRLIPVLGPEGAASLHRRLTLRALRTARAVCLARRATLEIRFDGGTEAAMRHWLGDSIPVRPQGDGDLGTRMARAFDESFRESSPATVIIGSDCPALSAHHLETAFEELSSNPVVLGPATDGGYYLIGLTRSIPEVFRGPKWGTATVLADSLQILQRLAVKPALLEELSDVDRPDDLPAWRQIATADEREAARISVIIPALNEAQNIAGTIANVQQCSPHETIVSDGGSSDETRSKAHAAGATVLPSQPGRACQMNAGAAVATGNIFLFLHADTLLPPGYAGIVNRLLGQPGVVAGAFRFQIAGRFRGRRLVEAGANLRSRWFQIPYGDQALFLRSSLFDGMGGFADLPIMEDYDFVRRLRRRGRIAIANAAAVTSGRRWLELGVSRTTLMNSLVIAGYHLGLAPARLSRFYRCRGSDTETNQVR